MRRNFQFIGQAAGFLFVFAAILMFGAATAARAQGVCSGYTITVTNPAQTVYVLGIGGTVSYGGVFTQTGGVGTVTFSLHSGSLPSGLTIAADGSVAGNTLQGGSFTFSVKATDSNGCVGVGQNITITNSSLGEPDFSAMMSLATTYGWASRFAWDTTTNPCPNTTTEINWNGVNCHEVNGQLRVTIIIASCGGLKLNQNLPPVLATLTGLKSLDIRNCDMNGNASTGGLDALTRLERLRLDNNPALSGTIADIFPGGLTTTRFPNLNFLQVDRTSIGGAIPESVMQFTSSTEFRLDRARFSGTLPATGNASKNILLNGNLLEGALPDYIRNATGTVRVRYNKFDVVNTAAGTIDTLDPGWRDTQTVPPTNVQVTPTAVGTATVSWTPIAYTAHGGYYEVFSSNTPGGNYVSRGTTASKSETSLAVSGLPNGINYFIVRTFTPAHVSTPVNSLDDNPNDLTSVNSAEVSAVILPPTAAGVSVGGRVFAPNGRGLANALIYLIDQNGDVRLARTNPFGYYRLNDVAVGQTYIFTPYAKRYQFAPQIVNVTDVIENLNFVAQ